MVLPILEYGTVIWSPHTDSAIKRVERIQKKFCKTLAYRYGPNGLFNSVEDINSLHDRRKIADLVFYYKVVNGVTDTPDISSCFELIAPTSLPLRRNRLLKTTTSNKNYVIYGPHNKIANLVNSLHNEIDFYGGTLDTFIPAVKQHLLRYC
ncbi:Protein of unknown function [Cotesia congregata]|uniref:Uncharacterized protein n=1 Tax=Cotesia congregata TaxID=51543 RepID=A0A8J2HIC6_COTCN|nr:Protein of unknown function [Cotesia congregata]